MLVTDFSLKTKIWNSAWQPITPYTCDVMQVVYLLFHSEINVKILS